MDSIRDPDTSLQLLDRVRVPADFGDVKLTTTTSGLVYSVASLKIHIFSGLGWGTFERNATGARIEVEGRRGSEVCGGHWKPLPANDPAQPRVLSALDRSHQSVASLASRGAITAFLASRNNKLTRCSREVIQSFIVYQCGLATC